MLNKRFRTAMHIASTFTDDHSNRGQNPHPLKENGNCVPYINWTECHPGFVSRLFLLPVPSLFVFLIWSVFVSKLQRRHPSFAKAVRGTCSNHHLCPL